MSTALQPTSEPPPTAVDERLAKVSFLTKLLQRPELGAMIGAGVVLIFAVTAEQFLTLSGIARWTDVASTLGIMAVAVALLMIGGEFDLGRRHDRLVWPADGHPRHRGRDEHLAGDPRRSCSPPPSASERPVVVRTGLPSFIVTLATFFVLQGVNLGVTKAITGTVRVGGLRDAAGFESAQRIFASDFWALHNFRISVVWWIVITALATWVLSRTRVGNWIFGVGGDKIAARNVGVPVNRVKVGLFMLTSMCAALVGIMIALRLGSVQAGQGIGEEFNYIIAAVAGGAPDRRLRLGDRGGDGRADHRHDVHRDPVQRLEHGLATLFLGVILFAAVLVNTYVRRRGGARS